ncbi:MAG: T9SS type A sorting domain-containing protein [Bacteroidota bacterium]
MPNFSLTFTDASHVHLHQTLAAGKSVLLDFFFVGCSYCQTYAPIIDQSYVAHGAGTGNILFWGISDRDANAAITTYKNSYGVTNPCAGTAGNGDSVTTMVEGLFTFTGWPTYSIICPDRTVHWDVNYPPSATGFDSYFSGCGAAGINENATRISYMFPVPAQNNITIDFYADQSSTIRLEIYDLLGNILYTENSDVTNNYYKKDVDLSAYSAGTYFVKLFQNNKLQDTKKFVVIK